MEKRFILLFTVATLLGISLAIIDTSPHWDDTGISVLLLFISALLCGYFCLQKPWLIALSISIWVPLFNIIIANNYGALLAFVPGFIGTYCGYVLKRKNKV